MSALELYCKGGRVWVPDSNTVWKPAEVITPYNGSSLEVEVEGPPELEAGPRFALEPLSLEEAVPAPTVPLATPSPLNMWQSRWPAACAANSASLPEAAHGDISRTPSPSPQPMLRFGHPPRNEDHMTAAAAACRPIIRIAGLI